MTAGKWTAEDGYSWGDANDPDAANAGDTYTRVSTPGVSEPADRYWRRLGAVLGGRFGHVYTVPKGRRVLETATLLETYE